MENLVDSFQLLSSMSPQFKRNKKVKIKKGTKLALKTNFRRSSIFVKAPQVNANLGNVDSASSEATSSETATSSDDSVKLKKEIPTKMLFIKKEESVIIIESSDDESLHDEENNAIVPESDIDDNHFEIKPSNNKFKQPITKNTNDEEFLKTPTVLKWVEQLDVQSNIPNITVNNVSIFSEVSTIFGENKVELNNDLLVLPSMNSTFVPDRNCFRLDELFKKIGKNGEFDNNGENPEKKDIDKSLKKIIGNLSLDDSSVLEDSFDKVLAKTKTSKMPITPLHEQENLLDELYGNSWRKVQEKVLPKTDKKPKKKDNVPRTSKTDIKPKKSLTYKNPYLEMDTGNRQTSLLRTMQSARLRLNLESPWTEKLKQLCDSDTHSEPNSDIENRKPIDNLKKKLNFDDSDDDDYTSKINDVIKPKTAVKKTADNRKKSNDEQRLTKKTNKVDTKKTSKVNDKPSKSVAKKREAKEKALEKIVFSTDSDSDSLPDLHKRWSAKSKNTKSQKNSKPLSFLASLSGAVPLTNCDPAARIYREDYKQRREELAKRLFAMFNENIFDNKLPEDILIEWSDHMRSTAGYCYCKKITRSSGAVERSARIKLATKVLDSADRLRNTLVHEMCHAAAWIINEIKDGHGPYWQSWTRKALKVYPELPPISRCHDYNIQTKYSYRCVDCGYSFGRHSKSVNIERKCCGYCRGRFEVLINKTTKEGVKVVAAGQRRAPNPFANFVKENYKTVKKDSLKHGDVMKILSERFKEMKVAKE